MGNDGELRFGTKLDSSGLVKELNGLGGKAKKALGSITKGVFAIGGALTAVTGIALNFKGELEQNLGGSEAVFGKYAKGLQEKAETAFKNMGLSASDYLATANKMGALFKGAGFEQEEAANKASEAMQRAADVASIMGIDVSVAMESIAGAAKGNFTMMDNLGVAMNDTTLNAYALEKGLGKTTKQMTNQEKVALAMEMFLDRTSYAAGNYAKENETLAGSLTTAKAALKNYLAGAGDVDDVVDSLTNAATVIMKNVKELLPKLVKGLGEGIRQILPLVPDMLRELIPAVASVIGELIATVAEMAPDIIIALAEGIGDSVPVLKPFTGMLATLAEHIDTLSVIALSGATAFITYKSAIVAMNVIQKLMSWFTSTTTALNAYNAALAANSAMALRGGTINGLLLSTLTPLQMLFGVLTGKIKLAEAAQAKFNLTLLKNPYTLAAAAIAALVIGIAAYAIKHKSVSEEIRESLDDIRQSHDEAMKAIDDNTKASRAEAAIADTLKNRLYELEGQLKSGTLTQEKAEEAQNNFKATAAKLEEIIPGIKDNLYDETGQINIQKNAVNKLTESYKDLMIAKAMATAFEEKLAENAKSLIDAEDTLTDAKTEYEEKLFKYKTALTPTGRYIANIGYESAESAYEDAKDAVEELETERNELLDGFEKYTAEYTSLIEGSSESGKDADDDYTGNFEDNSNTRTSTTKKETDKIKALREKELRDLQFLHNVGLKSDEEYYDELERYRDKYFEVGSEDWMDFTEEIYDYTQSLVEEQKDKIRDLYSDIAEYAEDSMEKVVKSQEKLENKLKGFGKLSNTVTIAGAGEHGEDITYQNPADIKAQTEALKGYMNGLETIKGRLSSLSPERASEFMAALSEMSIEEGTSFTDSLNRLNDTDLNEYLAAWNEKQDYSEQISASYYKDDFQKSIDDSIGYMKDKLTEAGLEIPASFFDCGKTSGEQFGESFMAEIEKIMQSAYSMISNFTASLALPELAPAGAGGTYTNYTNYFNVGTSKDTTDEQITAWTNATDAERMRNS